jgi:hypothetical protein
MHATWWTLGLLTSMGVQLACASAATSATSTLRTLPTHLSADATRLLAGCVVVSEAFDMELRCPDDVVVASQAQPTALEQTFLMVASEAATARNADVELTDSGLDTDDGPVRLVEARYLDRSGDDVGFLIGVSRPKGSMRDDLWCAASSLSQRARCVAIVTALLQPADATTSSSPPTTTTTLAPTPAPTSTQPPSANRQPSLSTPTEAGASDPANTTGPEPPALPQMGRRVIALPSSCRIASQDLSHGTYRCAGLTLTWKAVVDVDSADAEAAALLASVSTEEDPQPLPCAFAGRASCRGHGAVVVGVAVVDGVAALAQCVVSDPSLDVRQLEGCRALLDGQW